MSWTHLVRRMRGDAIVSETVHAGVGSAYHAFYGAQRVKDPYTAILIICLQTRHVIDQTNCIRFGAKKSPRGVRRNHDPYAVVERKKKCKPNGGPKKKFTFRKVER